MMPNALDKSTSYHRPVSCPFFSSVDSTGCVEDSRISEKCNLVLNSMDMIPMLNKPDGSNWCTMLLLV